MSLSSFFKKVTKEEYQKDMVDKMGHSVVLTEALIHTPSAQAKHSAKEKVKATAIRGRRDSNVSRAEGEETDGIEVVEVSDGDDEGEEAKENGDGPGPEAEPAKISSSLFKRRKERKIVGADDDISVDADFFNQDKPDAEAAEMSVDEGDGAKARAREGKISLKLFEKKKGRKGESTKRPDVADEDSVDMDFLSTSRKRPLNEKEEGGKPEKPLSPQLFKPSKRRKRGAAAGKGR